jgi:hypothetical protein
MGSEEGFASIKRPVVYFQMRFIGEEVRLPSYPLELSSR